MSLKVTFAAMLGVLAAGTAIAASAAPVLSTTEGRIRGIQEGPVAAYLGVPYAAPPVGPLRWRAPQPVGHWSGVRDAEKFGPTCPQHLTPNGRPPWSREYVPPGPVSENCLYLNVWTAGRPGQNLPILFWIHGGGFVVGSGTTPVYDGRPLASHGIVVVTINYRLGLLGAFTTPALAAQARAAHEPPANWGMQDVIAALRWVRRNAKAFGGNPNAITIAGQSAGSMMVQDLIISPTASGLFQRAISESGLPTWTPRMPSVPEVENAGNAYAQRYLGTTATKKLRALPWRDLMVPFPPPPIFPPTSPVTGGVLMPLSYGAAIASKKFSSVPLLVGMNKDESTGFFPPPGKDGSPLKGLSKSQWQAMVSNAFGPMASRVEALYPAHTDSQRLAAMRELFRDVGLASLYQFDRHWLDHSDKPVYNYIWTHVEPGPQSARYGAFHSSEIPYVFGTLDKAPERKFTEADRAASARMSQYWLNFIKTGDPNGQGLPVWPKSRLAKARIMSLGEKWKAVPILPKRKLAVMNAAVRRHHMPSFFGMMLSPLPK